MNEHTDRTLDDLHIHILAFDRCSKVSVHLNSTQYPTHGRIMRQAIERDHATYKTRYPKMHSLTHYLDGIRRKGPADNYFTGIGEGLHPQSKADYNHSNKQPGYEEQVRVVPGDSLSIKTAHPPGYPQMIRMAQERDFVSLIRSRVDAVDEGLGIRTQPDGLQGFGQPGIILGSKQRTLSVNAYAASVVKEPCLGSSFEVLLREFLTARTGDAVRRSDLEHVPVS